LRGAERGALDALGVGNGALAGQAYPAARGGVSVGGSQVHSAPSQAPDFSLPGSL